MIGWLKLAVSWLGGKETNKWECKSTILINSRQ